MFSSSNVKIEVELAKINSTLLHLTEKIDSRANQITDMASDISDIGEQVTSNENRIRSIERDSGNGDRYKFHALTALISVIISLVVPPLFKVNDGQAANRTTPKAITASKVVNQYSRSH